MRSIRRHHYYRLKKNRESYWGHNRSPKWDGFKVSTPKPQSSCMCCMNPRKIYGPTRQEIKNKISFEEQAECLNY